MEKSSSVYPQSKCINYFCRLSITDFNCSIASSSCCCWCQRLPLYLSLDLSRSLSFSVFCESSVVWQLTLPSVTQSSGTRWEQGTGQLTIDKGQSLVTVADLQWQSILLHLSRPTFSLSPSFVPWRHQVNYSALSQAFYFNLFFGYILIYLINFNRNAATRQQELPSFIKTTQAVAATTTTTKATITTAATTTARTTTKEKVNILLHLTLFIFCVCLSSADGGKWTRDKKRSEQKLHFNY